MEHFKSDKARFRKFRPQIDCDSDYQFITVQDLYRVTEDFDETIKDLDAFGQTLTKPMATTYNAEKKIIQIHVIRDHIIRMLYLFLKYSYFTTK